MAESSFINSFKKFVKEQGSEFPIEDESLFYELFMAWYEKKDHEIEVYVKNDKIVLIRIWLETTLLEESEESTPYFVFNPFYEQWEEFINEQIEKAPTSAKSLI